MRLEKVEISGFKSFCDRQEVDFRGGVTGIVGPNGCGKSNISDAISWVLGEQSAKSLRGSSMEDVIFAGSQSRQPVGMAEVNLRVSGLNGNSPDGNPECTVTRRLYRNGESEYLMNGHLCRLRDIHELFMDTGLGSKAYSIIEQGKIGLILSSKPQDRRALIEEAAGITKYKVRRRQTALKLEAAQQNLLRVNDIVHEVEKQLDSLKRQAGKARRYRAVRDELLAIDRVVYARRFLELEEQSSRLSGRVKEETEREQAACLVLEAEEAQMEVRRNALYEEEALLAEIRNRLGELTLAVDRNEGRIGYCKEQILETESRGSDAAREAEELEARVGPLSTGLAARKSDETELQSQLGQAEEEARTADSAVVESTRAQSALETELETVRDSQVATLSRLAALQNAQESVSANAERASADLLKLGAELSELERERSGARSTREDALKREGEAGTLVSRLQGEREAAQARAASARVEAEALLREAEGLQSEHDSLQGRRASLEEMVATHSAFDEGVRALLSSRPEGIEILGVVADCVETDKQHERAVEAFLGDRLQALLVADAGQALAGIRHLEGSGAGRGAFLPIASARTRADCGPIRDVAKEENKGLLSDLYRVTGPHEAQIRAALPDALVVSSLEEAFEIIARHGPVPCATLSGETARGSVVEGGRGVKGLLAPRREIREIAGRQTEVDTKLHEVRTSAHAASATAEAALAEGRSLEGQIHTSEKDLVAIRHDLAVAEEELSRLERKGGVLETERGQAEHERDAAGEKLREIETSLVRSEEERLRGSERLATLLSLLNSAKAATESAQQRSSEGRSHLAALKERFAAVVAECRRLEQDHADLLERISGSRSREAEMAKRREELRSELKECEALLSAALLDRDRSAGDAAQAEERVRNTRNELEAREVSLKERRRERETLRDALSELTVQKARNDSDLDHLARECQTGVGLSAAEAAAQLGDADRVREMAELEQSAQELRDRLERMGPVNVLAVEQSQELDERLTFLVTQRQDLLDSIAELDASIQKIDKASKERFEEAFRFINQQFGEVFRQLFGGGTAGLGLIDETDLLDSGIDIMAQPPGKRLQSVLLLSGGEKALTAIALLFAIFQYKPSPFCILDEVDAPLDDANIGRFVKMLEGLKDQTQFVLITHSRKTMEIADQLYGVTMEEPGVSKLVSVRFGT